MDTERRKRPANGCDNGRRSRPREGDVTPGATEEEVEEFFAILRRMHAAGKHFKRNNGNGLEITEKGVRWRPEFEWEDFAGLTAVNCNGKSVTEGGLRPEGKTESPSSLRLGGLDLNADPGTEHPGAF